ncbi:unnamed protein product [Cercopithifilaria johnstoni]|uniref:CAP-Gly domain-containing protein n=1 Tax=Cercopithifilaria johnstoni TaxID=2874296 RepID=A0A8J2PY29_9BILA|nr:unnamed protein product [Cercopithifilaria johnstoni]
MYKSTNDKVSNEGELIGKKDVGKKVIVGRVGSGTLMYVGPVEGKTGIFCGIELDRPEGKHDGTYQGIAYFHCAPQHGIFAPSYKVELLQQVPVVSSRRHEKLIRSAISAFAGSGDMEMSTGAGTTRSTMPSMDISMASVSSLGSSFILDHSMIGRSHHHYQLLEEIECPSELIEVDDDVPYQPLNTSLVLEESRIGVDRLPIVDDNLSTPLVEYAPNNDSQKYQQQQQQQQQNQAYMIDSHANHYNPYQISNDSPTELTTNLSVTQLIHPDILSYESEFPQQIPNVLSPTERVSSSMSIDSTMSDDVTVDIHHPIPLDPLEKQQQKLPLLVPLPEQEISPETPTTSTDVTEQESNCYKSVNNNFTITKESEFKEHSQNKNVTVKKSESVGKEEKKERPKKPRPLSIRELQNAPVPVRPPKSKPPSKSQLLMEKLKASIEADKLKPKKDVKSKLHNILAVTAPIRRTQPQTIVDRNEEEKMSPNDERKKSLQPLSPNAKRRRNEALKTVNSRTRPEQRRLSQQVDNATTSTIRSNMKSTQLLIQPKTVQKALHSGLSKSSATHPSVKIRKSEKQPTSMIVETQQQDDSLKLKRLTDAIRAFDILAIVFGQQIQKYNDELHEAFEENRKYESHMKTLEAKYEQLMIAMNTDHNRQIENGL